MIVITRLLIAASPMLGTLQEASLPAPIASAPRRAAGELEVAREEVRLKELAFGSVTTEFSQSLIALAKALTQSGAQEEARVTYVRALRIREEVFGPNSAEMLASLREMGHFLFDAAEYEEARALYECALRVCEATLPPDDPTAADCIRYLGEIDLELSRYE